MIRVWGEILVYILQRYCSQCQCDAKCKDYLGAIELLDPCWWVHYASCVLKSVKKDNSASVNNVVRIDAHVSCLL